MNLDCPGLVIIDMQNDMVNPKGKLYIPGSEEILPKIVEILTWARTRTIPIFHIIREHAKDGSDVEKFRRMLFIENGGYLLSGSWGAECPEDIDMRSGESRIVKTRFSGFYKTELDEELKQDGIKTLIITGVQTPNCIRATAVDAQMRDMGVVLVKDAIAAASPEVHRANLHDMKNMGMRIVSRGQLMEDHP